MDTKPNPGGRPRKSPDGEVRSKLIKLRVTPSEHAAIRKTAKFYQYDEISEFIRDRIRRIVWAAERESSVESVLAHGLTATDGIKRLDLDPMPKEVVLDIESEEVRIIAP